MVQPDRGPVVLVTRNSQRLLMMTVVLVKALYVRTPLVMIKVWAEAVGGTSAAKIKGPIVANNFLNPNSM